MRRAVVFLIFVGTVMAFNAATVSAAVNRYCIELTAKVNNPTSQSSPVTMTLGGVINGASFYTLSKTFSLPAGQTKTYRIHHFYPRDWVTASVTTSGQVELLTSEEQVVDDSVCSSG